VKKLIVATLVTVAAALALLVSSGAAAPDASQMCTALNDLATSHGQCVSTLQEVSYSSSGLGATDAVAFCKQLDAISKIIGDGGLLKGAGLTFGECVTFVKSE
jgi:hypothetical protein